jgi:hypothetical protein
VCPHLFVTRVCAELNHGFLMDTKPAAKMFSNAAHTNLPAQKQDKNKCLFSHSGQLIQPIKLVNP